MTRLSAVNRARLGRLLRTFREVYAETESLSRATAHSARFVGKKILPLTRYSLATFARFFVGKHLHYENRQLRKVFPVLGVRILGGIGDYIVIARFMRDLLASIEPAVFDIYSNKPKLATWIFSSLPGFRNSFDEAVFAPTKPGYTAAAQISQFIMIDDRLATSGDLPLFPLLLRVVVALRAFQPSIAPIIAEHPRLDSFLAQKAIFANRTRSDYLHYTAGLVYAGDELSIGMTDNAKRACDLPGRRYVTVHNGYDPNMVVSHERATKCYPHFGDVITRLRIRHPDMLFVQVGIHTSARIDEADINLISKTSLPDVAGLIRGAVLHIDNEGGLVHLARAMGTVSCVVYGPTSSRYFGYSANINIDPAFCGGCWWINETWMNHCPRGFATARCMTEQPASAVADAVDRFLRTRSAHEHPIDYAGVPAGKVKINPSTSPVV